MPSRDHVAVLLYALEQRYHPIPDHVVRLAMADIAAAGFDPAVRVALPAGVEGELWRGRTLAAGESTPAGEAAYFEHVLVGREWPEGATLAEYLRSLRDVILDRDAGVFIARFEGKDRIGAARRSSHLRGPKGNEWIVVVFDPDSRHWTCGWQPTDGLATIASEPWSDVSWLRVPR